MNADQTPSDVIYDALSGSFGDFSGSHSDRALDALAAAGYAVIKLPDATPTVDEMGREMPDFLHVAGATLVARPTVLTGDHNIRHTTPRSSFEWTPTQARRMAAALLAAADHQEKNR